MGRVEGSKPADPVSWANGLLAGSVILPLRTLLSGCVRLRLPLPFSGVEGNIRVRADPESDLGWLRISGDWT
jgi:hypothetical protein